MCPMRLVYCSLPLNILWFIGHSPLISLSRNMNSDACYWIWTLSTRDCHGDCKTVSHFVQSFAPIQFVSFLIACIDVLAANPAYSRVT